MTLAAIGLALILCPSAQAATHRAAIDDEPAFPDVASNPANLILRLVDLSRAYRLGNDGYCSPFFYYEEGLAFRQYQLDEQNPSYTCEIDFRNRGYAQWGRLEELVSNATVFARLDSAVMAYDAMSRGGRYLKPAPADRFGDASAFYVARGRRPAPRAMIVWRTGRVVSSISASGASQRWVTSNLLRLARVLQARIEAPTAVTPADNARRSIPILDPDAHAPIYWLGETFHGPGLPERRLQYVEAGNPGYGPEWSVNVDYGYISLGTWTRDAWRRFVRSRAGRQVLGGDPCDTTERVRVRNGLATIVQRRSAPTPPIKGLMAPRWSRCGDDRGDWRHWHFNMAYVRYRDHVVSINVPQCYDCVAGTLDRYDSPKGMRAIVRGLRQLRRPSP